jgi:hypothetical protein
MSIQSEQREAFVLYEAAISQAQYANAVLLDTMLTAAEQEMRWEALYWMREKEKEQ